MSLVVLIVAMRCVISFGSWCAWNSIARSFHERGVETRAARTIDQGESGATTEDSLDAVSPTRVDSEYSDEPTTLIDTSILRVSGAPIAIHVVSPSGTP